MRDTSFAPTGPPVQEGDATPLLRRRISGSAALAALGVVATGLRLELYLNVTLGTVIAVALAPVWVPQLRRFQGARLFTVAALVCLPIGFWLTELSADDRYTSQRLMIGSSILLLNIALGTGLLLWARCHMPTSLVGVFYGLGLLAAVPGSGRLGEDPWRFGFSVPLSVLALAGAWYLGRRWLEVLAALALAAVTAASGGRSMFAMLVLAAVLTAWQAQPRVLNLGISRLRTALFLAAALAALYALGQSLTLEGYLGESAQQRTERQMQQSGSVILGGRPELGASLALLQDHPVGYGTGARLNAEDVLVAKSGMAELGYDPNNGYVEKYMFGDGIELHSFLADLWADFGIAGLALGALIAWKVWKPLSAALARRSASALLVFVGVQTSWNLFFSPRYGSFALLVLTLGLLAPLAERPAPRTDRRLYSE